MATLKSTYLLIEGTVGALLYAIIDWRLSLAFVCGMVIGGLIVYSIHHKK